MLNHFKVTHPPPPPPHPRELLPKTSRSGPVVCRHVGEPRGFSAGFLSAVPSHFHLSEIVCLLRQLNLKRFPDGGETFRKLTWDLNPQRVRPPCRSGRLKMICGVASSSAPSVTGTSPHCGLVSVCFSERMETGCVTTRLKAQPAQQVNC